MVEADLKRENDQAQRSALAADARPARPNDDNDDDDAEEEEDNWTWDASAECPLCTKARNLPEAMFQHWTAVRRAWRAWGCASGGTEARSLPRPSRRQDHGLDLDRLRSENSLDFYEMMRFINFTRHEVRCSKPVLCGNLPLADLWMLQRDTPLSTDGRWALRVLPRLL